MRKLIEKTNPIPIVFITDNNFVMQTSVSITSLITNRCSAQYKIFVVGAKLSDRNKKALKSMANEACSIDIIDGNTNKIKNLHKYNIKGQGHYLSASEAALFKFDLPNLLPTFDKAIYIDGDTIILNSLDDLYNTDLEDKYVAAAHDTGKIYFKHKFVLECPEYFNSGVMLLNLDLMRKDNITDKLIETKLNLTDSNLMDQNVLNLVFKDRIKIIDIKYNLLVLNLERAQGKWEIEDINRLFNSTYIDFEDIKKQASVIHFSSKDKPWKYSDVTFAKEWYNYYKTSPFGSVKLKRDKKRDKKLIISLTSYPARINTIHLTIESILKQTFPADKIILWLAPEQFPNKEQDLPPALLNLTKKGLTIEWYHDIRSYKKLIPTLLKYPNAIIITADDDTIYDKKCIELLYQTHIKHKKSIICHRGHYISFNKQKKLLPYTKWKHCCKLNKPTYNILQTGVGAVLYPPNCFYKDILNERLFTTLAYDADDLWFWAMALLNGTKICIAKNNINKINYIDGTQETGLWHQNVDNSGNDEKLQKLITHYPKLLKKLKKKYPVNSLFENIFSIKNIAQHKVITILGISLKLKNKKLIQREQMRQLEKKINIANKQLRDQQTQIESLQEQINIQQELLENYKDKKL